MRLGTANLRNYRSCYQSDIKFDEYITLLVGENDAGKSNIVDALRASVAPASGPPLYFDIDRDLSYGIGRGQAMEIVRTYCDLTVEESAFYTPALVDSHRNLVHRTVFRTDTDLPRRHRISHSVGDSAVPDPEPENRERIVHVYLPPLRDAARALDSADGNRLADIFEILLSPEEIAAFEKTANKSLGELATNPTARRVVEGVQIHLSCVTRPVRHRIVDVKHRDQRLRRLTRALRLNMAAEGLTPSDLLGSGLGYANLLYIATVVLELARADEYDLMLLLVEEPEAHLHPQLQSVLLAYLQEQAVQSATKAGGESGQPAGRIQVIATSHSPYLASSVSTNQIVVARCADRLLPATPEDTVENETGLEATETGPGDEEALSSPSDRHHSETLAISLSDLHLSELDRRKIDRYLNATRASLLFARQVVLVEGIAESVLLRTLAERVVFPASADSEQADGARNKEMREQFRAITVLPIDGVDFMPYLQVLLSSDIPLADRVVVVTDGDNGAGEKRQEAICAAFPAHCTSGCLSVHVGATTFEAELFGAVQNEGLLREAFTAQHPRSLTKWDAVLSAAGTDHATRAAAFSKALKDKDLDLGKGDFAQVVAQLLEEIQDPTEFVVPAYLREAICAATLGDSVHAEEADSTTA